MPSRSASAAAPPATPALNRRAINRRLFAWHRRAERALVVRRAETAWGILVVEVMSQQTRIDRIGPAWARFIDRWPSPADLAAAGTRDLLAAWAGLGYNRRALALRAAARVIVRDHDGRVPRTVAELELLPGIGPYTARAVAASAFGRPVAPVDVNVRRVVGRLVGGSPSPGELQAAADALVSRHDPRRWVNAVMDLAATVCLRRQPDCVACPIRAACASRDAAGRGAVHAERREARDPFVATNRWLRGRLLALARDAPAGSWLEAPDRLGEHGAPAIREALEGLAADGFLELRDGRARLAGG